jgi:predicted dehydrogenase
MQADFEKMLKDEKLDVLVVTTVDATHDQYIVPALYAGIRVLTEKPMTTWVQLPPVPPPDFQRSREDARTVS